MKLVSIKLVIAVFSKLLFRNLIWMGYRFSTSSNMREASHTSRSDSPILVGYPGIQLDSDTICLEITSGSIGEGLSPTGMPLLPHPHLLMHTQIRCSCKVLAITCASGLPAIDQRFSWPPNKLGSVNFLEWLTELREIFYWLDYFF